METCRHFGGCIDSLSVAAQEA
jgi:hypothetical protein